MKKFFKFVFSVFAFIGAAVGALAILDKISNKNAIKGDYLECDVPEDDE